MTQITLDTDKLVKWIAIGLATALIGGMAVNYAYYSGKDAGGAAATTVTVIMPTATPEPTSIVPTYPSTITFTVMSTTTANGDYRITTTAGQILICANYYDWNSIQPQDTYNAVVTGTSGSVYYISTVTLVSRHYQEYYYPDRIRYYEYNGKYYQNDGRTTDEISWKEARGQNIYRGRPPQ